MSTLKAGLENIDAAVYSAVIASTGTPTTLSEVTPYLWISNHTSATNIPLLKQYGITTVISVSQLDIRPDILAQFRSQGIECYRFPLVDVVQQPLIPIAPMIHTWLMDFVHPHPKPGKVLLNCTEGISRSCSVVLWHLITGYHMSYDQAFNYLKTKRPFIRPNHGFEQQLRQQAQTINA
ncbi:MAG: putative dual specificity protein phosphatase 1B-like [Sylvanvirus sp.]|uniref:Putative dual specificity protein phosphatase 1B-like n=1 Tax=Sylvanvirus sp. TaxID=2487774 RepID=A0A3G5AJM2_9VIRU|nr:MAG: putative dual specificity protein phosphatase 1B-like [Sylvanvirus sp.]